MDGLSEEDIYVRESETNIAIWKTKKIIKALHYAKGHGDSLFSFFMDPTEEISIFTEMLDDEFTNASSINMYAIGAITSAQKILKGYTKLPPNGLIIYTGTVVTDDGKEEKDIRVEFEPFKPLDVSVCQLHHRFHIETLSVMVEQPKYGFIVMADNKALIGTLCGNEKKVLKDFKVNPPLRQIGGADHEIDTFRAKYLRVMAKLAKGFNCNEVSEIVVAASPTYQTDLIDMLDPLLQKKIICRVEVSYGGLHGFNEAIELSSKYLYYVRLVQEMCLLKKYLKEIGQGTNRYVFGVEDTLRCLDSAAVKILIVWENLEINSYVLKNTTSGELTTMHLSKEQETDRSNFRDTATNAELEIQEKMSLLEWFTKEYKKFGCTTLEFVTDSFLEGSQFCRAFGGIGGILHYQLDLQLFDDHSDGDQLDIGSVYDLWDDGENYA